MKKWIIFSLKNNKPYRVNFGNETFNHFADQNEAYLKEKELEECLEYLDKLVRSWSFSKKHFITPKEI